MIIKKSLREFAKKNHKEIQIQYVEVPAGGVSFHHGYTWHGSGINTSNEDRRAVVAHCVPSHSKFHPTNTGGTARVYKRYKKTNSNEMDESFFPILWSKKEGEDHV
jgi:ectoine hydroxylase-related dioxygenase (phytanoyl-CoA dioxygenase family)